MVHTKAGEALYFIFANLKILQSIIVSSALLEFITSGLF